MAEDREAHLQRLYRRLDAVLEGGQQEQVEGLLQQIDQVSEPASIAHSRTSSQTALAAFAASESLQTQNAPARYRGLSSSTRARIRPGDRTRNPVASGSRARSSHTGSLEASLTNWLTAAIMQEAVRAAFRSADVTALDSSSSSSEDSVETRHFHFNVVPETGSRMTGSTLHEALQELVSHMEGLVESHRAMEDVVVPLVPELLQKIPVYPPSSPEWRQAYNTQCHICLCEMASEDPLENTPARTPAMIRLLPCRHAYHQDCIDTWLKEHTRCPECKADLRDLLNADPSPPKCASTEEKNKLS